MVCGHFNCELKEVCNIGFDDDDDGDDDDDDNDNDEDDDSDDGKDAVDGDGYATLNVISNQWVIHSWYTTRSD